MTRNASGSILVLFVLGISGAQAAPPADLPPAQAVARALDSHPAVAAAHAGVQAAQVEHERLQAGEYEMNLRLATQRRETRGGPGYTEWEAGLERSLRLPGKARLDAGIGLGLVEEAEERQADARHETAKQLLNLWYDARQTALEADLWRRQTELLQQQRRIVEARVKRGDAAKLEAHLADAAVAQAQSRMTAATAKDRAARAELLARFPELPAPEVIAAPPMAPEQSETVWQERTLDHNHELQAIQRALERARLLTRRAEAERMPDPSLGLYLAGEQGGNDRIFGVSLSLPLAGQARRALPRQRQAEAEVLAAREAETRRRLAAEASSNWHLATAGAETWARLTEAAQAVARHADLAQIGRASCRERVS
jgi:outer membrane protein TolC